MAFNGTGQFVRLFNWVSDAANSINITASRMDSETQGIADGLSNCVTRDGQGKPTAAIDWNGQSLSNVSNLTNTGNTILGAATANTLNVGNGGLVKDANGNVGIGQSVVKGKLLIQPGSQTVLGALASSGLNLDAGTGAAGNLAQIGFGYTATGTSTNAPAAIFFTTVSNLAFTNGDIVFATRSVTTDTAPTERLRISAAGLVTASGGLSITTGAVTSGTWTPTLTANANVTASSASVCQYTRVGDVVTCSGEVSITPTSTAFTNLGVSLPVASTLATSNLLAGTGTSQANPTIPAQLTVDTGNNRARIVFTPTTAAIATWGFHFTYKVI